MKSITIVLLTTFLLVSKGVFAADPVKMSNSGICHAPNTTYYAQTKNFTPYRSLETGMVVKRFSSCDYYIADGPRGLYVLEWYGGHDPKEGERIIGNIGAYGMKEVVFPDSKKRGRVWVEDFLETPSSALQKIRDKCR